MNVINFQNINDIIDKDFFLLKTYNYDCIVDTCRDTIKRQQL